MFVVFIFLFFVLIILCCVFHELRYVLCVVDCDIDFDASNLLFVDLFEVVDHVHWYLISVAD